MEKYFEEIGKALLEQDDYTFVRSRDVQKLLDSYRDNRTIGQVLGAMHELGVVELYNESQRNRVYKVSMFDREDYENILADVIDRSGE